LRSPRRCDARPLRARIPDRRQRPVRPFASPDQPGARRRRHSGSIGASCPRIARTRKGLMHAILFCGGGGTVREKPGLSPRSTGCPKGPGITDAAEEQRMMTEHGRLLAIKTACLDIPGRERCRAGNSAEGVDRQMADAPAAHHTCSTTRRRGSDRRHHGREACYQLEWAASCDLEVAGDSCLLTEL